MFGSRKNKSCPYLTSYSGHHDDYERILNDWSEACEKKNLKLPPKVIAELQKRIKLSLKDDVRGCKAKLNFSNCGLCDKMVVLLVDVLTVEPVISILDLSRNTISDKAAICLIRLIIHQAQQVRGLQPESRLEAVYISSLILDRNNSFIQEAVLEDIKTVSSALSHVNVKAFLSKTIKKNGMLTKENLPNIWYEMTGNKMDKIKFDQYLGSTGEIDGFGHLDPTLCPIAFESILIDEFISRGYLDTLTTMQLKLITFSNVKEANISPFKKKKNDKIVGYEDDKFKLKNISNDQIPISQQTLNTGNNTSNNNICSSKDINNNSSNRAINNGINNGSNKNFYGNNHGNNNGNNHNNHDNNNHNGDNNTEEDQDLHIGAMRIITSADVESDGSSDVVFNVGSGRSPHRRSARKL